MKHIDLDQHDEPIRQFVLGLPLDFEGSILEVGGKPIARLLPVTGDEPVDLEKLKAAILERRDESRVLNDEWEAADREAWEKTPDDEQ